MTDGVRRWGFILVGALIVNLAAGVGVADWPTVAVGEALAVLLIVWALATAARLTWGPAP